MAADTADLLRRAKAGDRDAMNDAIRAFLPWAKKRARSGKGWPWRDEDEAFSAALDSLWKAILILPDGYTAPTGPAAHIYKLRQVDELRRKARATGEVAAPVVAVDRSPSPPDAAIAAEESATARRLLDGFKREAARGYAAAFRAGRRALPAAEFAAFMSKQAAANRAWRARRRAKGGD